MAVARTSRKSNLIDEHAEVNVLTATGQQGRDRFDREAHMLLGISGEEFLRNWDAGEYEQVTDFDLAQRINSLCMMLPFVRSIDS